MPEGQPQSQEELMRIEDVTGIDLPDGDVGEGLRFRTSRGSFNAILHRAPDTDRAVIWVCGASGGFGGPGPGTYARMAEKFVGEGITSLRLDYRQPNDVFECAMDLLAGVAYLKSADHKPVVVVGHSFGGAVVIAAGANSAHIKGIVALSPQTYGAGMAGQVAPRRLLVVHGKADTRLAFSCGQQIYDMAREPKELVLYEGAEHRLEECRDDLEELLGKWIPETLATEIALP
ncbi:MAG: alpha/beta fold hydrolase [Dehalococcoidia bacterium]|nr:alpha/beta fold hydrolase [Dehalococcoidia bacterium]|tara:strand:- start:468 stop:1163 length:696 start_codon:yes stop_codon:yes gene_type:complete